MSAFTKFSSRREMKDILKAEGFVFGKVHFSSEEIDLLKQQKRSKEIILSKLKQLDPEAKDIIVCKERFDEGAESEMHTHLYPCEYMFLTWIPHGKYKGREFVYGKGENLKTFKPSLGDVCFMKVNDLDFKHGVNLNTGGTVDTYISFVNPENYSGLGHLTLNEDGKLI